MRAVGRPWCRAGFTHGPGMGVCMITAGRSRQGAVRTLGGWGYGLPLNNCLWSRLAAGCLREVVQMNAGLCSRHALRGAAVGVLVAMVAVGCSASNVKPVGSPRSAVTGVSSTTTVPTTSTTSVAQVESAILTQWRAAEEASVAAAKDPGGTAKDLLVDYFVDPALSFLQTQYAAYARDGLTNVGDIDNGQPRVKSLTASEAVVVSCETNRLALTVVATGKPFPGKAGDPTPTLNGVTATMVLTPSGVWKLSTSKVDDGSCAGL
jgi:hypothetical protein